MDLSALVSVSSLLLWAAAFLYFRSYLKRRTGSERILQEFREEVEKLVADIDSATDRDSALVEERIRSLRVLLDDADRRIATYSREIDRRAMEEKAYSELGRRRPLMQGSEPAPIIQKAAKPIQAAPLPFAEQVSELSRAGFSSELIAKRLGATLAEVDLAVALTGRMETGDADDTGN
ncbi:hypothetical protein MASR2M78_32200 [Treponema sp.]